MAKHYKSISLVLSVATTLLFASLAQAANIVSAPTNIITSPNDIVGLFCGALLWMFWGLIVVGIAMFIIGGYTYATSKGDPEKVGVATKTLMYAAIAIAVGLIAQGIPALVGNILGGTSFGSAC